MAQANPLSGPWQDCTADILGPLPSGENLLVIVDYYGRYFEVVILTASSQYLLGLDFPTHLKWTTVLGSFQRSSKPSLWKTV